MANVACAGQECAQKLAESPVMEVLSAVASDTRDPQARLAKEAAQRVGQPQGWQSSNDMSRVSFRKEKNHVFVCGNISLSKLFQKAKKNVMTPQRIMNISFDFHAWSRKLC